MKLDTVMCFFAPVSPVCLVGWDYQLLKNAGKNFLIRIIPRSALITGTFLIFSLQKKVLPGSQSKISELTNDVVVFLHWESVR